MFYEINVGIAKSDQGFTVKIDRHNVRYINKNGNYAIVNVEYELEPVKMVSNFITLMVNYLLLEIRKNKTLLPLLLKHCNSSL